jgi:hypothetical protein
VSQQQAVLAVRAMMSAHLLAGQHYSKVVAVVAVVLLVVLAVRPLAVPVELTAQDQQHQQTQAEAVAVVQLMQ